jgi:putative acetyltransferase
MAVYHDAVHTLAAPYYTAKELEAWAPERQIPDRWRERLAQVQTLVIEEHGTIAGFVSYDLTGHLDLLFVHPGFARRGVATRLCAAVERELHTAGVSKIFTEASLAARDLFAHCGYRVVAEESVECRGVFLRRYAMAKPIGPT